MEIETIKSYLEEIKTNILDGRFIEAYHKIVFILENIESKEKNGI